MIKLENINVNKFHNELIVGGVSADSFRLSAINAEQVSDAELHFLKDVDSQLIQKIIDNHDSTTATSSLPSVEERIVELENLVLMLMEVV